MDIQKLSAQLDQKLQELDQRLTALQSDLQTNTEPAIQAQLQQDFTALQLVKEKLIKSQALAWRAHELQTSDDDDRRRSRRLGLFLCFLSGLGLVLLLGLFWWTELR